MSGISGAPEHRSVGHRLPEMDHRSVASSTVQSHEISVRLSPSSFLMSSLFSRHVMPVLVAIALARCTNTSNTAVPTPRRS